jgi:hypothetical protein
MFVQELLSFTDHPLHTKNASNREPLNLRYLSKPLKYPVTLKKSHIEPIDFLVPRLSMGSRYLSLSVRFIPQYNSTLGLP